MAKEEIFEGQSGAKWRYWLDQPLGTPGGFGGVYAAEAEDGTPMAVKVVRKQRQSGALDTRLLRREIEIGRRVAEAGGEMLLPVIDARETDEALLLVMTRADRALADVPLPVDESTAIAVLTEITTGLQQLHSIGVIHRDLKPANVLRHDGQWKLADFGIARDEEIGTRNPTFLGWGSPPYMSPEIWSGKSPTVKTDLYALGCIGFELLAGHSPFTGDPATLRDAHLSQMIPDIPSSNATLRNLITRLLAKEPGGRPQDARAVLERLRRIVLPRSAVQDEIARGLGAHAAEKSRQAAARTAAEAAEEEKLQQVAQARADLREMVDDALADLQDVEPDAQLQDASGGLSPRLQRFSGPRPTTSITLSTEDARLRIEVWENAIFQHPPAPEDTMILACAIVITNRRYSTELNAANLVYEQLGDRLGWNVYRFRASGFVRPDAYSVGPYGRTHGLKYEDFFGQWGRHFMLHPATHVWQKDVEPLTLESLLGLFREAVDLRSPDPRTGIWP